MQKIQTINIITLKVNVILFCLLLISSLGVAQVPSDLRGARVAVARDSLPPDTLSDAKTPTTDTLFADLSIVYSKDSLESPVKSYAFDSIEYDLVNNQIILYRKAKVNYQDIELEAYLIYFNWKENVVTAEYGLDSLGNKIGRPVFKDKGQEFTCDKLRYNFKTKKGIVYDVTTQQKDLYVLSEKTRFEGKDERDTLSNRANEVVYASNSLFTTCDHPEPHYGIRSQKQKIINNKLIVVGPSNLEIAKVPTPLWLPFGFFPITKDRQSGLLLPRDYEFSQRLGFGFEEIGYYWAVNDYMDLALTGDIYTRGSWRLHARSNYAKRYKFQGGVSLDFGSLNLGELNDTSLLINRQRSFSLVLNHRQDNKAHPSQTFGGSINFSINNYNQNNRNDARSVLNNTLASNLSYSKNFVGTPFTLTTSFTHRQNTLNRDISIQFPVVDLRMRQIYPFKRKKAVGEERWYEKIALNYDFESSARLDTKDTMLLEPEVFDDIRYGVRQGVRTNASFRVFKYFNFVPSVSYEENWYFKTRRLEEVDDEVLETAVNQFKPFREFDARLSLNTQVFATAQFTKGKLQGIRYIGKPSVSMSYIPDYTNSAFGYFETYTNDEGEEVTYDVFGNNAIYGRPSTSGMQMNINYSISNILEAKYLGREGKDTTLVSKKIRLFRQINVGGSYNLAADSLNFSQVNISGNTKLIKNITDLRFAMRLDPYALGEDGNRINTFQYNTNKKLLRFVDANVAVNSSLNLSTISGWFKKDKEDKDEANPTLNDEENRLPSPDEGFQQQGRIGRNNTNVQQENEVQFFSDFSINHNFTLRFNPGESPEIATNNIYVRGTLNLSEKWKITVGNFGYDFQRKDFSFADVSFYRDLHCWEMGMSWQPTRQTYSFFVRVKPSSLDFLNIPYGRNQFDGF